MSYNNRTHTLSSEMVFTRDDVIDFVNDHIDSIFRMYNQDVSSPGVVILSNDTHVNIAFNYSFTKQKTRNTHIILLEDPAFREAAVEEIRSNFVEGVLNQCYLWKSRCWCVNVQSHHARD